MRFCVLLFSTLASCGLFFLSAVPEAYAGNVTLYAQTDDSGEMISQQPTNQSTSITSASLGTLYLGKGRLTLTFTMKDPNTSEQYGLPEGIALETCANCRDLQRYYFTAADRRLLSDGEFHTFTIQTETTALGTADGETPVYITFFGLMQIHLGTHLKSNAGGTIPALRIEVAALPPPPDDPQAPEGSISVYEQSDKTGTMSNPQPTFQNSFIDSADLGNLNLGQGPLYLTFSMKSPTIFNLSHMPDGVCIEPAGRGCGQKMQTYYFTDADRNLLADGAFHTFTVLTGTTTSTYADGTNPVNIGFFGLTQYQYMTKLKSNADASIPFLSIKKPDPCIAAGNCASNILFLPGIEGSRLYEGTGCGKAAEEKLWEPYESLLKALRGAGDAKVKELSLDASGASACSDVYAKPSDVIDSVGGSAIYASLVAQMDGLKSDGTIRDWKPVAYDWRLSLPDLLSKGSEHDGRIYYEEATSTPYIEQTLRALAGKSKSGKATIVAHSNGGLLAKALLNKLGSEASKLVDKIVMVGAPQSGAPEALGVTLVGHDAGIYSHGFPIVSNAAARTLAQNSPMAYHLLPSQSYFDSVMYDPAHPVARFAGDAYAKEASAYGPVVGTLTELDDFLLAKDGGREKPKASDLSSAEILNSTLIDYANSQHNALDGWAPPAGIEVSQIAGWGVDTVAGIDFYTSRAVSALTAAGPVREYKPIITEDGDGTVPVPSALMMASSTSVKRYWVDLANSTIKHADIFENADLRTFVKNIITNNLSSIPVSISTSAPITSNTKKLTFLLHSPLTLELADGSGHVTGLAVDGSIAEDIPGSTYGEFGEVKYVSVPQGGSYTLSMHGQSEGTFSLDIEESSGGVVTASSTLAGVPTTASTLASLSITDGIDTASPLTVDENGDGGTVFTLTPRAGETVSYEPPAPAPVRTPAPQPVSSPGSISIPFIAPLPITLPLFTAPAEAPATPNTPIVSIVASSTPEVATTSVELPVVVQEPSPALGAVAGGQSAEPQGEQESVPQTASAYDAFQQSFLQRLAGAVYNGLSGIWSALMRFF